MDTLAPWAEPVLMTADELLRLPEDEWCYELVEGRLVRMSPTGAGHGRIVLRLIWAVTSFVSEHQIGEIFPAETGFLISAPDQQDTVLAPDLAFVRTERLPETDIEGYPRVAPDLVVEVVSPSQTRAEMAAKARRWLDAGVRLVWVVLPRSRTVEVWRNGTLQATKNEADELSGEDVLPGFVIPIAEIFP